MTVQQLITPNPNIPAEEGMCLQYVRQTFGLPARYASATEAWLNSPSQHRDRDYPQGVWFPVWWALDKNVNGHVALVAPDGRVYSTSNLNPNPLKVHPNVADVEAYYARYGFTLTYRGWTEDVAGTPVISTESLGYQGDIIISAPTVQEDDMSAEELQIIRADINSVHETVIAGQGVARADIATVHNTIIRDVGGQLGALREIVKQIATGQGVEIDYDRVEAAAKDGAEKGAAEALGNGITVDVTLNGAKTNG